MQYLVFAIARYAVCEIKLDGPSVQTSVETNPQTPQKVLVIADGIDFQPDAQHARQNHHRIREWFASLTRGRMEQGIELLLKHLSRRADSGAAYLICPLTSFEGLSSVAVYLGLHAMVSCTTF